jgi:hypothetical protein
MMESRPEFEVLRQAARVILSAEQTRRLVSLLGHDLDWASLIRQARAHGVMPLLAWQLGNLGQQAVPVDVLAQLRADLQDNAVRNLVLSRELLELLALFHQAGIRVLPFKGPTLTVTAYGNLALRRFMDLDVLVHGRDVGKARDVLLARGYQAPEGWTARHQALSLHTIGQLSFQRGPGMLVELHGSLLPGPFSFALEMDELWSRRQTIDLLGREVPSMAAEDLLLLLCAHGAKHLWQRLMWVCDVAELVRAQPGLCWERAFERARQLHAKGMLLLGLRLALSLLEAPVSRWSSGLGSAVQPVRRLAADIERRFQRSQDGPAGPLTSCAFYLRVRERLRDGLRYCLSMAVTPTEADWMATRWELPLPGLYLIRAMRLASKYMGYVVGELASRGAHADR